METRKTKKMKSLFGGFFMGMLALAPMVVNCDESTVKNKFAKGCLFNKIGTGKYSKPRLCNSEDAFDAHEKGLCSQINERLNYTEIRVKPGNWESAMISAWIMQVATTEILGVPVSMEMNGPGKFDFYDPENSFDFPPIGYDYDALKEVKNVKGGDCRLTNKPCAHVLPEIWDGQNANVKQAVEDESIEPPIGTGYYGQYMTRIPDFAAKQYPQLTHLYGLQGDEKRKLLAELFKRPTTWGDYCELGLAGSCAPGDATASRKPTDTEKGKYFVDGLYTGHFRDTPEGNCTANPTTCVGNFVDEPCEWTTFAQPQFYWHNVGLQSFGNQVGNNGYSYGEMLDIAAAGNATQSPYMLIWWVPDVLPFKYNLIDIQLTKPTLECEQNRVSTEDRCSDDPVLRRGDEAGACDYAADILDKVISSVLQEENYKTEASKRNPAYDFLKNLRLKNVDIDDIVINQGTDPRDAVCTWLANNVQEVEYFIPRGFPRDVRPVQFQTGGVVAAMGLGIFVVCYIVLIGAAVTHFRDRRVMRYAHVGFLKLVLFGMVTMTLGALVSTVDPSFASCTSKEWLINVGYTLGAVPLLVKVAAINKLTKESMKMKRVKITQKQLYGVVFLAAGVVSWYLLVWTLLDPPKMVEDLTLIEGSSQVNVTQKCGSKYEFWNHVSVGWRTAMVLFTGVIAFQNRGIKGELNESGILGAMVYSRCTFIVLIVILHFLSADSLSPSTIAMAETILFSFDAFIAITIYFVPKLITASGETPGEKGGADTTVSTTSTAE